MELQVGEYTIPEGCTLERTGKFVSIRPIHNYVNKPRCYDCKHCGSGKATKGGFTTTICLIQPKHCVDRDGGTLYYHIGMRHLACEKFEKKED